MTKFCKFGKNAVDVVRELCRKLAVIDREIFMSRFLLILAWARAACGNLLRRLS
jgi:hypothetical protein